MKTKRKIFKNPSEFFTISVLHWSRFLFFREDSRLVRRAALKHHSARHGLGSKTVEQELTERTEVLR
jgi:hypothetical protein